jgi:hypothetical protein
MRLENYELITFTLRRRFTLPVGPILEMVGSQRSVGAFMAFPLVPESSSYLPGILFGSREFLALRWSMPRTILREVASQSGFTWRLCLPMWGSDVDGLASPLHRPMAHSCQARGHVLSARCCLV